jgi:NAD+ synthase
MDPVTDCILSQLALNANLARRMIVGFLRDELGKMGFTRGVVGLSGGIDSSLVACLAVEALGRDSVLGVMLPYRSSNPQSEGDARRVIEMLGIPHRKIEITPMVEPLLADIPTDAARRRGNIMARMRMICLYDQSEEWQGLVIGTGNKTENLLGYTTVFGDNAAAVHPIADLYKCQVRQLAQAVGVPQCIIDKPPSADLWAGQTDEGELGFSYDEADQILYLLVDLRYTPEEVVAQGFETAVVRQVVRLIRRNQFKRVPPPICKISTRTVGIDFLYLRDWGV